jgi:hemoglobin
MSKLMAFEKMGGRNSLIHINKIFYDKVYKHPWLKQYFEQIPQQHIED